MSAGAAELPQDRHDNRLAFSEQLTRLAREDERVVAVCNDSVGSSQLVGFKSEFPERLINVGIAEQALVGVAAGLANAGMIPFVCAASPFLTGRALEQIKIDVVYNRLPVILCGMSPGMAYGQLGPTHHSVEDLSWLRALPGLDIVLPADRRQTRQAVCNAAADPRPTFIRVGRRKVPDVTAPGEQLLRGRMCLARPGTDVTIVAIGTTVSNALDAAASLAEEGIDARVLNAAYLAPFDIDAIVHAAIETRAILTVEDASVSGGLGAAVAMCIVELPASERVPVKVLGLRQLAPTGGEAFLLEYFGLDARSIAHAAHELLERI